MIIDILWAQLFLVGLGATLQLIAFFTFTRDPHAHGGVPPDLHLARADAHGEKTELPILPPPANVSHLQAMHPPGESAADLHPAALSKTAKVSFKQQFKGLH